MEKKWYLIMVVVPGDIRRRKVPSIKIFWSSWCLFVQQIPVFRSLGVKKLFYSRFIYLSELNFFHYNMPSVGRSLLFKWVIFYLCEARYIWEREGKYTVYRNKQVNDGEKQILGVRSSRNGPIRKLCVAFIYLCVGELNLYFNSRFLFQFYLFFSC